MPTGSRVKLAMRSSHFVRDGARSRSDSFQPSDAGMMAMSMSSEKRTMALNTFESDVPPLKRQAPSAQITGTRPPACRACCTQLAKVGYRTPSRRANSACVNPLRCQAPTNSSRRAAGVILRPTRSRFSPASTRRRIGCHYDSLRKIYASTTGHSKRFLLPHISGGRCELA